MSTARTLPMPLEGAGQFTVVIVLACAAFVAGFVSDQPFLMAAAGLAPIAGMIAWSQPFIVCSLFIAFSYFRLPEAYPSLVAMKPALVLGVSAVALVATKALLSPIRDGWNVRSLRVVCLVSLIAVVGLAFPFSLIRTDGSSSLDPLMIPVIMICAAIACVAWTQLLSSTSCVELPINVRIFSAYFVFMTLATIFSVIPSNSYDWWSTISWKVATMTLATSWLARSQRDLVSATNIFILSGILIAAVVIYNKIYGISLVQGTRVSIGRVISDDPEAPVIPGQILSDPNDLSLILMFPLAFALARITNRRSYLDAGLALVASGVIVTSIIFTQSRGAAIGVMAVLAMLMQKRFKSLFPVVMVFIVAAPLLLGAMGIAERESGGYAEAQQGDLDQSSAHRIDAWKTAVNMAASRPLTGVGLSNFQQLFYRYTDHWFNREIAVHSMWFQVLAELGLPGFALFIAMIWTSFKVNAQSMRWLETGQAPMALQATGAGLQAALAGTCASGTFLSQAHTWPLFVIVAMIAALSMQAGKYAPAPLPEAAK